MSLNFHEFVAKIILTLEQGKKPRLSLTSEIQQVVINNLEQEKKLKNTLLILRYLNAPQKFWGDHLLHFKNKSWSSDLFITYLGVCHYHILERCQRDGEKVPKDYLDILKTGFNHPALEVKEWSLRSIIELGYSKERFKPLVFAFRPSLFKIFNRHQRNILQMRELFW